MVPSYRCAPLLAVSLLLFLTACQDDPGSDGPVGLDLTPSMSHVTVDNPALGNENNGLFFFRPPTDTDEPHQGFLDVAVKPILYVELCNIEGLVGFDPFATVCPTARTVARLDDTNPVAGQTLTIASAGSFDFYEAVLKLSQLSPNVQELHTIRVMIGAPETTGGFFVPGYLPAIFTDNASEADSEANPPIFRVGDLPVKFFLSDLATRQLVCGDVTTPCTYEVWDLTASVQDLCHPVNDCTGSEALAGLRMAQAALQEVAQIIGQDEILVFCSGIDLTQNPDPLGTTPLTLKPVFVDCGFTPTFGTLTQSTFDVQLCMVGDDGLVAGHLNDFGVVEFLGEAFGSFIFGDENCGNLPQLAGDPGLFDKIRYAALNGFVRPLARVLGPQPLWARDATSWTSTSASPFGAVLRTDVNPNQGPDPIEEAGSTVLVSVCLAIQHLNPKAAPGPDDQLPIVFEVITGSGSIEGGATKTVVSALRDKATGDECDVTDGAGQIAEASVLWDLSAGAELNELKASIAGDYAEIVLQQDGSATSEPVELSHTFSTQTIEVLAACTVPDAFADYDQFAHRGFYILPSEFGIVGDGLKMVQLRISSNNSARGKGAAGEYRVSLSARDGSYDPASTLQTVETSFTLSGAAPENQTVSFMFDQLPDLGSTPVTFVAEILDAPKSNAKLWYRVPAIASISGFPQMGDPSCTGAIVTNGTTFTTPLDTDRRQGMDIKLLGVDKP